MRWLLLGTTSITTTDYYFLPDGSKIVILCLWRPPYIAIGTSTARGNLSKTKSVLKLSTVCINNIVESTRICWSITCRQKSDFVLATNIVRRPPPRHECFTVSFEWDGESWVGTIGKRFFFQPNVFPRKEIYFAEFKTLVYFLSVMRIRSYLEWRKKERLKIIIWMHFQMDIHKRNWASQESRKRYCNMCVHNSIGVV